MKLTENFSLHEFTDSATAVERRIDNILNKEEKKNEGDNKGDIEGGREQ